MGVGGQRQAPAALPPGKTRYPSYKRLGGPPARSGRVWKISPPPGFDPRTVQPVASRYTDWALPAGFQNNESKKKCAYQILDGLSSTLSASTIIWKYNKTGSTGCVTLSGFTHVNAEDQHPVRCPSQLDTINEGCIYSILQESTS